VISGTVVVPENPWKIVFLHVTVVREKARWDEGGERKQGEVRLC
jgi:hypothetical protein